MSPCAQVPPPRRSHRVHRPLSPRVEPRWPRALAVAALALLVLLPATLAQLPEAQPQAANEAWPTDVNLDPVPARPGETPRPVPNQKRAPCTVGLEREIAGACWVATEHRPPSCPPQTVAYEGKCLLPVATPRPVPSTVDGDGAQ